MQYRVEADMRLESEQRMGRLQLDGAPPGYTICVEHGNAVRVFNAEGEWIEAGGVCEFCWKEIYSRPASTSGQRVVLGSEGTGDQETGLDGSDQGQTDALGEVQGLQAEDGVDIVASADVHDEPHASGGNGSESGDKYWDDAFGFPVSMLREK